MPDSKSNTPKGCVITLGMHRSGTSAMSGALAELGVCAGRDLMLPQPENPKGYFENNRVVAFNDRLLQEFGMEWDDPFPLPDTWWERSALRSYETDLEAILNEEYPASTFIGIKDPRLARLLPWWLPALKRLNYLPTCVLMLRHPREVASSLRRRGGMSEEKAELLWITHMLEAERASRGIRRCVVRYDALIHDPISSMRRVLDELELPLHDALRKKSQAVQAFVSPDLQRHQARNETAGGTYEWAERVYAALLKLAEADRSSDEHALALLDDLSRTFERERQRFLPADLNKSQAWSTTLKAVQAKVDALEHEVSEQKHVVASQQEQMKALQDGRGNRRVKLGAGGDRLHFLLHVLSVTLRHPVVVLRQCTSKRIKIAFRALTVESPEAAMQDFSLRATGKSCAATTLPSRDRIRKSAKALAREASRRRAALRRHFKENDLLVLGQTETTPVVSVIMVLYNRAEWTLAALKALQRNRCASCEVILVDNASTDETARLLDTIKGVTLLRNTENLHFLKANNQALPHVRGKYVLLLNNDTEIAPDAIEQAIETLQHAPRCGAVGARLLLSEYCLQEAGSIVWSDGSCLGSGRGDDPEAPPYNFVREVDYCSGAFLLTFTALFRQHGGFDERFAPAYYEEVDYCFWLQQTGYRVLYDPRIVVRHAEFGGEPSKQAIALQKHNRAVFVEKRGTMLSGQLTYHPDAINVARFAQAARNRKRILYIDDRVPHSDLGSGFPRANAIVNQMQALHGHVTVFPMNFPDEPDWESAYKDIDRSVELVLGRGRYQLSDFLAERQGYYDLIWISRPHNMEAVKVCGAPFGDDVVVVYDAEALFAQREVERHRVLGSDAMGAHESADRVEAEVALAHDVDVVVAVSEKEAAQFRRYGINVVHVLKHVAECVQAAPGFGERAGLLFVGNLEGEDSPNADSMIWFVSNVWPLIKQQVPEMTLDIVGSAESRRIRRLEDADIRVHGRVDRVEPYYARCRLFIAPTRFSAGIPLKIYEAAAQGLPVVATSLLADQLGWTPGRHLWTASADRVAFADAVVSAYADEATWQQVQAAGLDAVRAELSQETFRTMLSDLLSLCPNRS